MMEDENWVDEEWYTISAIPFSAMMKLCEWGIRDKYPVITLGDFANFELWKAYNIFKIIKIVEIIRG